MNAPKLNYWVDVSIAVGFVASAASGVVFLLPGDLARGALGLSLRTWSSVHTWSSLILVAGVGAHVALHWRWIVHMTRRQIGSRLRRQMGPGLPRPVWGPSPALVSVRLEGAGKNAEIARDEAVMAPVRVRAADDVVSRRSFLGIAGGALVASGALGAGILTLLGRAGLLVDHDGASAEGAWTRLTTSMSSSASSASSGTPGASPDTAGRSLTGDGDDAEGLEASPSTAEAVPTPTPASLSSDRAVGVPSGVACRRGYVNDPYPGQCRHYVDLDGDGICDESVPGSGSNVSFGG
jgi:hypothetical protein